MARLVSFLSYCTFGATLIFLSEPHAFKADTTSYRNTIFSEIEVLLEITTSIQWFSEEISF